MHVFIPELRDLIIRSIRVKTSYFTHNSKLILFNNFVLQHRTTLQYQLYFDACKRLQICTLQFCSRGRNSVEFGERTGKTVRRTVSIFKCDINYLSI